MMREDLDEYIGRLSSKEREEYKAEIDEALKRYEGIKKIYYGSLLRNTDLANKLKKSGKSLLGIEDLVNKLEQYQISLLKIIDFTDKLEQSRKNSRLVLKNIERAKEEIKKIPSKSSVRKYVIKMGEKI